MSVSNVGNLDYREYSLLNINLYISPRRWIKKHATEILNIVAK